jgi:microsomal epoxide hydrolase
MAATPAPFRLEVPDEVLADLRARLARTRWPDEPPVAPWSTGTSLAWLHRAAAHWADGFDWRAQEAALNGWPQHTVALEGVPRLHYLHAPGHGPAPLPLVLSHGWPGSVFEFLDILPLLVDPAAHGGDARDAFTVVAPSLPGYALSHTAGAARLAPEDMARAFHVLMTEVLGHARYGVQGGDWGASVSMAMAAQHPDSVVGMHLNLLTLRLDGKTPETMSDEERAYQEAGRRWVAEESGYQAIQGTKPQTLAYGLNDSPAGLLAWIGEKFHAWSDCGGAEPERAIDLDRILGNVTLYWVTGSIGASFWPYYAVRHGRRSPPRTIGVPMGFADFPAEMVRPPRSLAERTFTDIRRWTRMPHGGHFAAMEQPQALAEEIRAFFRPLRG